MRPTGVSVFAARQWPDSAQSGVGSDDRHGFRVHERIDFSAREVSLERRKQWRGEQYVAMMHQANDENTPRVAYPDSGDWRAWAVSHARRARCKPVVDPKPVELAFVK